MTSLEKVRLRIGDTDVADALFSDAELESFLDDEGTVIGAAAGACESLAARWASEYDIGTDDQSLKRSQKAAAMLKLAPALRQQAEKEEGIGVIPTEKVDAYNDQGVDNESFDGAGAGGRVRQGYQSPDQVP